MGPASRWSRCGGDRFLDAIGYDIVDAGPPAQGRRFQPGTALYGVVHAADEPNFAAFPAVPASSETVRSALAAGR